MPTSPSPSKPDWGHGPNEPVVQFTLTEIVGAMESVMHSVADAFKIDLVVAKLREIR